MAMMRWNPMSELMTLQSQMDRLVAEVSRGLGLGPRGRDGAGDDEETAFLPVDVERSDDAVIVCASVPGFSPDQVDVSIDNGVLSVEARRGDKREQPHGHFLRRERFSGRLFRQVQLPEGIDDSHAEATFEHGVLTVRIPLAARPESKRIPVQAGGGAADTSQSG